MDLLLVDLVVKNAVRNLVRGLYCVVILFVYLSQILAGPSAAGPVENPLYYDLKHRPSSC